MPSTLLKLLMQCALIFIPTAAEHPPSYGRTSTEN